MSQHFVGHHPYAQPPVGAPHVSTPAVTYMIRCGQCTRVLLEPRVDGVHEAPCYTCNIAYLVQTGTPTQRVTSGWLTHFVWQMAGASAPVRFDYQAMLALASVGSDQWGLDGRAHRVSLLWTVRNGVPEDLISVRSHSLGTEVKLRQPKLGPHQRSLPAAVFVGVFTFVLLLVVAPWSVFLLVAVVYLPIVFALLSHNWLTRQVHWPHAPKRDALAFDYDRQNELLEQKLGLLRRHAALAEQRRVWMSRLSPLMALHERMTQANEPLYRPRIAAIEAAITSRDALLHDQEHVEEEMVRMLRMIDIEMEAELLGSLSAPRERFAHQLSELRQHEHALENMRMEIEAQIEVENLLRA